nr:reticulon 4 interacting protein 1 [Hymenolepis microstoma]
MLTGYGATVFRNYRRFCSSNCPTGEFPFTPGHDFAGIVADSGPNVSSNLSFPPGSPVMGATMPYTSTLGGGCLSDYFICPATAIAKRPEKLDPVLAAAVSYSGLTAWGALSSAGVNPVGRVEDAPKRVLVTGVTGAVGAIAAQLSRIAGTSHISVTAPPRVKPSDLKSLLGVDEVILAPEIPNADVKYDVIIDCVRPEILKNPAKVPEWKHIEFQEYFPLLRNLESSNCSSRYVIVNPPLLQFIDQWGLWCGIGTSLASLIYSNFQALISEHGSAPLRWTFFQPSGERLEKLADWLVKGLLHVPVEKVYDFENVPAAFEKMAAGVLTIDYSGI